MDPRCHPIAVAVAFSLGLWPLQGLCTRWKRLLEVPERSKLKSVIQQRSDNECLEGPVPYLQNPLADPNQEIPKAENFCCLGQEWGFPRKAHSFLTLTSFPEGNSVSPTLEGQIHALPCPWASRAPAVLHMWPSPEPVKSLCTLNSFQVIPALCRNWTSNLHQPQLFYNFLEEYHSKGLLFSPLPPAVWNFNTPAIKIHVFTKRCVLTSLPPLHAVWWCQGGIPGSRQPIPV